MSPSYATSVRGRDRSSADDTEGADGDALDEALLQDQLLLIPPH